MSGDRSKKDNVSPVLKPTNVGDRGKAPPSSMGTLSKAPALGGSPQRFFVELELPTSQDATEHQSSKTDTEKRADYLSNLPEGTVFTLETGDKEIDQQSVDNGDVPVSQKELETLRGEGPTRTENTEISQSDFAKAFNNARQETWEHDQENGQEIE